MMAYFRLLAIILSHSIVNITFAGCGHHGRSHQPYPRPLYQPYPRPQPPQRPCPPPPPSPPCP
ncbi:unnamed protein product, partial [Brugia timori]